MAMNRFWWHYNHGRIKTWITEASEDVFSFVDQGYAIAHFISSDLIMNTGIARLIRNRYGIDHRTFQYRRQFEEIGYCIKQNSKTTILHLVTKVRNHHESSLETVFNSLVHMIQICVAQGLNRVVIPRTASGLDGKPWEIMRSLISFVFQGTPIHVIVVQVDGK